MTKVPIQFLIPMLAGGGAERATLELAGALDRSRFDVTVVVEKETKATYQIASHLQVVQLRSPSTRATVASLVRHLHATRPAILYSALPHLNFVACIATALGSRGTRNIVSVHNNMSEEFRELPGAVIWRHVTPWTYRRATRIVCVSRGVRDEAVHQFDAPSERTVVLANPINTDRVRQLADEPVDDDWFSDNAGPVFLGVGRLVAQKNFSELLTAFALLNDDSARLVLLGDGPERAHLESLSRDLGVQDRVRFAGAVQNPFQFMRRARALVLSSRYEGFGMALVEAMAAGTATIAARCNYGPDEICGSGAYGDTYSPGDVNELARLLARAVRDETHVKHLKSAGTERAEEYDTSVVVPMLEALMDETVSGR